METATETATETAHEYREYLRIAGPGPHPCEACGVVILTPENTHEGRYGWHCGCKLEADPHRHTDFNDRQRERRAMGLYRF